MAASLKKIKAQFVELKQYIPRSGVKNDIVSGASVGWHISHCLKVCTSVIDALAASNPAAYKKEFSLPRTLVLASGYIPRGKARAPELVLPLEQLTNESLLEQLQEAHQKLENFHLLPKKAYFEHPYFRKVSKNQTPRFLQVHTQHHLKIIRDILASK